MGFREFAAWEHQARLVSLHGLSRDASMAGDQRTAALAEFKIRSIEVGAKAANAEQFDSVGRE